MHLSSGVRIFAGVNLLAMAGLVVLILESTYFPPANM